MGIFDTTTSRLNTYSTQWDFIEDRFGKKDLLPFSISDTDFKAPEVVLETLRACVEHGIFGYTRWNHNDFKGAIQHYYESRHKTIINPEWIVYSPSVMYTVSQVIRKVSQPNDGVAVFDPMYDAFGACIRACKREIISIRFGDSLSIDWHNFERALKNAKVLLLCSPHNPTGKVFSNDELVKISELCLKYKIYVISDEIHADIILTSKKHIPFAKVNGSFNHWVLASSASKTFNIPGLGGSFALFIDEKLREDFIEVMRTLDFVNSANVMGMRAMMTAYNEAFDYIDELVDAIKGNMLFIESFIKKEIPEFLFKIPEATYLAWIDTSKSGFSMTDIQKAFIEIGEIAVMNGAVYGDAGSGYLRLNAGCPRSKLEEGLRRMKKAIEWLREKR